MKGREGEGRGGALTWHIFWTTLLNKKDKVTILHEMKIASAIKLLTKGISGPNLALGPYFPTPDLRLSLRMSKILLIQKLELQI